MFSLTDFRENILDIVDEWGGYPTLGCGEPASNAGHVQLKCYINNVCPFYKTPKSINFKINLSSILPGYSIPLISKSFLTVGFLKVFSLIRVQKNKNI